MDNLLKPIKKSVIRNFRITPTNNEPNKEPTCKKLLQVQRYNNTNKLNNSKFNSLTISKMEIVKEDYNRNAKDMTKFNLLTFGVER